MKNFSQIINEVRTDSVALLKAEVTAYMRKVNRVLPKNIQDLLYLTDKYGLLSSSDLDAIRTASKSQFPKLSEQYSIPVDQLSDIYSLLKSSVKQLRLLPQYQTKAERMAIEAGQLTTDDLTIDLTTSAGRTAAAKIYAPLVLKIASQYVGKSRLDRPSLVSAGMEGLTNAMNDWKREGVDGGKKTTFKTYAAFRIQQAILNEINANGHALSGACWQIMNRQGYEMTDAISIDDKNNQDLLQNLGIDPTDMEVDVSKEEENWKEVFKLLENAFSTRDVDIFYRYFGLGPYRGHRQKSKDIAKDYGMSESNIRNAIISKIIKFLQTNPKAMHIMSNLKNMYMESLIVDLMMAGKDAIREAFYADTTYIMLEEITRWNDKQVLYRTVISACDKLSIEDAKFIFLCLTKGMDYYNDNFRQNKKLVIFFLGEVYPMENMTRKTDAQLADYMGELIEATKLFRINW